MEVPHDARERSGDEALVRVRVVQPPHLERDEAFLAEVHGLLVRARLEVPEVDALPVATRLDVGGVKTGLIGIWLAELGRDEHVLARLVPEVVVERRRLAAVLPAALDLERLRVEDDEAAGTVAVGIAEHRDDDVVARHAVDRVRSRIARLLDDLLGLDHLLDPGSAWVVGDVDDVDPRRPEAGHDQVRAVGAVAGRRAAVPAEVVELVARVGHRHFVDDPPVVGVDDRQEVRRVDSGAFVQADEIEELLGRGLHRLLRRAVKRG